MELSYRLLANAVDELSQIQEIGKRTLLRLILPLLDQPKEQTDALAGSFTEFKKQIIIKCWNCQNISQVDNICLSQLTIGSLIKKVENDQVDELIFPLNATVEGNATNFYFYKRLKDSSVKLARMARGIPLGDDLEFADQITLGRSITQRVAFENSLKRD